ncbi:MAG: hypothetical protein K6T59_03460 [Bryobacteraceae bacterium]|nr:hypothetical protein [Bryobacteraceae bacterium]
MRRETMRTEAQGTCVETMERWTRECGRRAGLEFGEGFRRYKGHPYPQTPLLEELLGSEWVVRTVLP